MALKLVCKTCGNDDVKTNMCEKCDSCNIDCAICMESFKNNHTSLLIKLISAAPFCTRAFKTVSKVTAGQIPKLF